MGLSLSLLLSSCKEVFRNMIIGSIDNVSTVNLGSLSFSRKDGKMTVRTLSFKKNDPETVSKSDECDHNGSRAVMEKSLSFKKWEPENPKQLKETQHPKQLKTALSFKNLVLDSQNFVFSPSTNVKQGLRGPKPTISVPEPTVFFSPRPVSELDAAAVKLQKVYKSYRTRRNLADCAVVVEELWWKAIDFATLRRSSVSFFNDEKQETAVSRWARARTRAAKVGKGLSKDEKAQKLALQHWLEAIDPRHRYGHNLHFYYDIWFHSESTQPFFYWLDVGDGKEVNVVKCPRTNLQRQCIKYLGPKEREVYEVVVESGKLVFRQSGIFVNTAADSKWIFVLSTSRALYVGKKEKGVFQHSSFLAGGAITAAGRMVAQEGVLEAIWPYSGHYHPTEENFQEFISFLEEHGVDLANVKKCAIDEDNYSYRSNTSNSSNSESVEVVTATALSADSEPTEVRKPLKETVPTTPRREHMESDATTVKVPAFEFAQRLSQKWSTGAGPRIGIVRDYPTDLQNMALEHVNLSPRVTPGAYRNNLPTPGAYRNNLPIPSPRPSPKIRLSPRISYMGLPSPRVIPVAN